MLACLINKEIAHNPQRRFKGGRGRTHCVSPPLRPPLKIPPESPPPRIILVARRPQNRSGIRSALTRSDLVLGRLLVQRVYAYHFLVKSIIESFAL